MRSTVEVAIIGAGPYGLSVAAQLQARGVPYRIFGEPMRTWRPMPRSLCLKSLGFATSIAVPARGFDFPGWLAARGLETVEPISYAEFTAYGLWVQEQVVPEVEAVDVRTVRARSQGGHELLLEDGSVATARKVVVATGLHHLQQLPPILADLPPERLSHSFGQYDFRRFAGQEVAVIGAGQSALEVAVLLREAGARPVVVARQAPIFHGRTPGSRPLIDRLRAPLTVLGAGRLNWVLEHFPWLLRKVPEQRRLRFALSYLGPSGAWWLRDRFEGHVPVLAPADLLGARTDGDSVVLRLGLPGGAVEERRFAHVVAGSGFRHDVRRLRFLDPALLARVAQMEGLGPRLSDEFESTAPGLHFIGPLSACAFGPLFRFVCGAEHAAPRIARHLASQMRRMPRPQVPPSSPERPSSDARAA